MSNVPEIDGAAAIQLRDRGAIWIDVREGHEWQAGRIAGTEHVPMGGAAAEVASRWPDPATPFVVSCKSGGRSAHVARQLIAAGYVEVHNLAGGIIAWQAEGRPVVQGT